MKVSGHLVSGWMKLHKEKGNTGNATIEISPQSLASQMTTQEIQDLQMYQSKPYSKELAPTQPLREKIILERKLKVLEKVFSAQDPNDIERETDQILALISQQDFRLVKKIEEQQQQLVELERKLSEYNKLSQEKPKILCYTCRKFNDKTCIFFNRTDCTRYEPQEKPKERIGELELKDVYGFNPSPEINAVLVTRTHDSIGVIIDKLNQLIQAHNKKEEL